MHPSDAPYIKQTDREDYASQDTPAQSWREAVNGKEKPSRTGQRLSEKKQRGRDWQPVRSEHSTHNN